MKYFFLVPVIYLYCDGWIKSSSILTGLATGLLVAAFLAYASFHISFGAYLIAFCRKPTKEKLIALSFDDGPHPEYTPQTLNILKQYDLKATFFVIGARIAGNENILKRIHTEGHQTGNHSFSHKNTFPLLGAKKMAADLLQCEQAIEQVTGCAVKWFRPPFGVTNPNVAKAVKIRNYKVAGWSIRSLDTVKTDKDKVVRRVVSKLHPGAVVLLHDHLPDTPYILEQIIVQAKEKGYEFVTVERLFSC
jgi:peptidoglycan/xylan/chitin deacetylase (PgdA/CDA1 family)